MRSRERARQEVQRRIDYLVRRMNEIYNEKIDASQNVKRKRVLGSMASERDALKWMLRHEERLFRHATSCDRIAVDDEVLNVFPLSER